MADRNRGPVVVGVAMKLPSLLRGLESREGKVPLRRRRRRGGNLVADRRVRHSGSAKARRRRHYSLDVSALVCPLCPEFRRRWEQRLRQRRRRVHSRLSTRPRSLLRFRRRGDTLAPVRIRVRRAGPVRSGGGVGSSRVRGSRLALRGCTATRLASPGTRAGYRESAADILLVSSLYHPSAWSAVD